MMTVACGSDGGDAADAGVDAEVVQWEPQEVPTEENLLSVWGRAHDDVWAVGWRGTILHYDGETWSKETTTSSVPLTQVRGIPLSNAYMDVDQRPTPVVFATGWKGTILSRRDGGTWELVQTSTVKADLLGLAIGGERSGLAVGGGGRMFIWSGGDTWTPTRLTIPGSISGDPVSPSGSLERAFAADENTYMITGSGGATYRSTNGLQTFSSVDTTLSEPLRGVWGNGGSDIYAVGLGTLVLHYDGSWQRVTHDSLSALPSRFLFGIDGRSGEDDLTVVGWGGFIARMRGENWFLEDSQTTRDLREVWYSTDDQTAFAVGANGTVLKRPVPDAGTP